LAGEIAKSVPLADGLKPTLKCPAQRCAASETAARGDELERKIGLLNHPSSGINSCNLDKIRRRRTGFSAKYAAEVGLVVATLLTLVFLPALYVAWFRIRPAELANTSTGEFV
jgi:hypothetical protein